MRPQISIRGFIRPSVHLYVCTSRGFLLIAKIGQKCSKTSSPPAPDSIQLTQSVIHSFRLIIAWLELFSIAWLKLFSMTSATTLYRITNKFELNNDASECMNK